MWIVKEHRNIQKSLKNAPIEIHKKYIAWKRIIENQGPQGLKLIKGFHDEKLKGEWEGYRSSRLNLQWRVIYLIEKDECVVYAISINSHKY